MEMSEKIDNKKKAFAEKYTPSGEPEKLAILAAIQHNPLYSENLKEREKKRVKDTWTKELQYIGERYKTCDRDIEDYLSDVKELCKKMNDNFHGDFDNTRKAEGYAPCFRISHAQKSLSIYLKHTWCRGERYPVPPVCPIDGNVLNDWLKIGYAWTKCNSIDDLKAQFAKASYMAASEGYPSMFEWELCKWESDEEKRNGNSKNNKSHKKSKKANFDSPKLKTDLSEISEIAKSYGKTWEDRFHIDCSYNVKVEDRREKALACVKIHIGGVDYYLFAGIDGKKSYFEIFPKDAKDFPEIPDYYHMKRKGGKGKPYMINDEFKPNKEGFAEACVLMGRALDNYIA